VFREGAGLSFLYYAPTSAIAAVPLASVEPKAELILESAHAHRRGDLQRRDRIRLP
jgi:hypothetical protein